MPEIVKEYGRLCVNPCALPGQDSRITEDVQLLSVGFTEFFTAGMYTATTGVFYSLKLYWEFGFGYMAAPFLYFLCAGIMQPKLGKMKFSLYQLVGLI